MITNEEIKKWKPLVKKISYKYINNPYRLELEDIEQIGYIGLIKGLRKFDNAKGNKLVSYLYSNIKWTIDRELDYLKLDKRCTLNQSTSLDITISDDENLTIADTLIDFKINIVEAVEEKLLMQEYKEQIEKTLVDPLYTDIAFRILFNDLSLEDTAIELGLSLDYVKAKYRLIKDRLRRNMFIRSRYKEYIENKGEESYKYINYYKNVEYVALSKIGLEEAMLRPV